MGIQTSNFRTAGKLQNAMSIASYSPRWYKGSSYRPLAPYGWMLRKSKRNEWTENEFKAAYYNKILLQLNPSIVAEDLDGFILLCWEEPGEICHRRYAAEWIEKEAGIIVSEYRIKIEPPKPKQEDRQTGLF